MFIIKGIVYSLPPPVGVYGPMQQQQQQQRLPAMGTASLGSNVLKPRQMPFYDSRVPPPMPLTVFPTSNTAVNGQTRPPNPVPYGYVKRYHPLPDMMRFCGRWVVLSNKFLMPN